MRTVNLNILNKNLKKTSQLQSNEPKQKSRKSKKNKKSTTALCHVLSKQADLEKRVEI